MMKHPIRQLSPYIASLIAAGEVIKRPEDIVRELIDNSIDAGANQIDLFINQGGLERIQIRDNGLGIPEKELSLALMHHTTSKISCIEDIEHIKTLGFRGEALASISAVAHLTLTSRTEDSDHGWEVMTTPGKPTLAPKPTAHPIGTTITVTDLFHHIPARRRFLRSAATEFMRIQQWVKSLMMSHPDIGFQVEHNKRLLLQCPPSKDNYHTQVSRLASLYSPEFAKIAIPVEHQDLYTLSGWISPPAFSRNAPDWQQIYVNKRLIKDKAISHAIKQAYQDVLYRHRHPVVLLFLTVDPAEVDVNIHPTKAEVRFQKARLIYDVVYQTLLKTLRHQNQQSFSAAIPQATEEVSHNEYEKSNTNTIEANSSSLVSPKAATHHKPPPLTTHKTALTQSVPITLKEQTRFSDALTHQDVPIHRTTSVAHALGTPLAQLHHTYILAQNDKGLVVVDAHAAHERVLYEELKASLYQKRPRQHRLLVPLFIPLTPEEKELLLSHQVFFKNIGFEYSNNIEKACIVEAIPAVFEKSDIESIFQGILRDLQENGTSQQLETQQNHLLANIACRRAIQANRKMSMEEMTQLLRLIEMTPHSGQCNHGRPTWKQISLQELDSWFLRGK